MRRRDLEAEAKMSSYLADRVEGGNCIVCNRYAGGLYFCPDCSVNSEYENARVTDSGPWRGPTATVCSRVLQRRTDQAAAYEQFMQMQTIVDAAVVPERGLAYTKSHRGRHPARHDVHGIRSESGRSRRIRVMAFGTRHAEVTVSKARVDHVFKAENWGFPPIEFDPRKRKVKRALIKRVWWFAFSAMWEAIGFAVLDDATRPEVRCAV